MKLKSMTEFVLQQSKIMYRLKKKVLIFSNEVVSYAEFLKQPITLGMFVPVDETGNVLPKPTHYDEWISEYNKGIVHGYEQGIMGEYLEAKEKVMFEGFKIAWNGEEIISIYLDDLNLAFDKKTLNSGMNYTIEYLCQYKLQLTPSALKQIDL